MGSSNFGVRGPVDLWILGGRAWALKLGPGAGPFLGLGFPYNPLKTKRVAFLFPVSFSVFFAGEGGGGGVGGVAGVLWLWGFRAF